MKKLKIALIFVILVVLPGSYVSANLLTVRDFETGDLSGLQVSGDNSNTPEVVQDVVRDGRFAMKAYVSRSGDDPYRTEAKVMDDTGNTFELANGDLFYIADSIFIPDDFVVDEDEQPETPLQVHYRPDDWDNVPSECGTQPPLALRVRVDHWEIVMRGKSGTKTWQLGALAFGEWTDWTIAYVPSVGSDGRLQVWRGGSLLVDYNGSTAKCEFKKPSKISFGLYKWSWKPKHGRQYYTSVTERTYYHDEFRIGSTFEEVQPGTPPPDPTPLPPDPPSPPSDPTFEERIAELETIVEMIPVLQGQIATLQTKITQLEVQVAQLEDWARKFPILP